MWKACGAAPHEVESRTLRRPSDVRPSRLPSQSALPPSPAGSSPDGSYRAFPACRATLIRSIGQCGRRAALPAAGPFGVRGERGAGTQARENFWASAPLQSQIWRRVPLAVAPDGESMQRPLVGLEIEPSALATQFW
jgi:hypothetical protein